MATQVIVSLCIKHYCMKIYICFSKSLKPRCYINNAIALWNRNLNWIGNSMGLNDYIKGNIVSDGVNKTGSIEKKKYLIKRKIFIVIQILKKEIVNWLVSS